MTETLFTNAKLADGSLKDIGVAGGRIVSIAPAACAGVTTRSGAACRAPLSGADSATAHITVQAGLYR